jgi:hypothetical protein
MLHGPREPVDTGNASACKRTYSTVLVRYTFFVGGYHQLPQRLIDGTHQDELGFLMPPATKPPNVIGIQTQSQYHAVGVHFTSEIRNLHQWTHAAYIYIYYYKAIYLYKYIYIHKYQNIRVSTCCIGFFLVGIELDGRIVRS